VHKTAAASDPFQHPLRVLFQDPDQDLRTLKLTVCSRAWARRTGLLEEKGKCGIPIRWGWMQSIRRNVATDSGGLYGPLVSSERLNRK
jgi:hypothetical protein